MYKTIFKDNIMKIKSKHNSCLYHEVEVQPEIDGELDKITIDKDTGKIVIRFKRID